MNEIDTLVGVLREAYLAKRDADQAYKQALHELMYVGSDCDVTRATGMSPDAVRMYRKRHPETRWGSVNAR